MKNTVSLLIFFAIIFLILSSWVMAGERQVAKIEEQKDSLSIKWYKYDEGLTKAQSDDKHILLFFRTKWCKWCNIMEKTTFTDQEVVHRFRDDFVSIKIDINSKDKVMELKGKKISDRDVAGMYNVFSFPYLVFLEPDQENIGVVPGYVETKDFLLILEYIGDGYYKSESLEEFAKRKKEEAKEK